MEREERGRYYMTCRISLSAAKNAKAKERRRSVSALKLQIEMFQRICFGGLAFHDYMPDKISLYAQREAQIHVLGPPYQWRNLVRYVIVLS